MVGLFDDFVRPFGIYVCVLKFFDYATCFNSAIARKEAMTSPKVIHLILLDACLAVFKQKRSFQIRFYKLMKFLF